MANGHEKELQHNLIATNMFTQADSKGRQFLLLEEILDFRVLGTAVEKKDGFTIGHNRNQHKKKASKGYELHVLWKDRNTNWIPLQDIYINSIL